MYKIIGADGQEYGPVSADQLRRWLAEGRADGQTRVQAVGTTEWKPLSAVPELATLSAPPVGIPSPTPNFSPAPKIPNYLVQSILATLFCCLPFGIVAIVYAAQVNSKVQGGDIAGAEVSSRKAKRWCWISLWSWLAVGVIYLIIMGVIMLMGAAGAASVAGSR